MASINPVTYDQLPAASSIQPDDQLFLVRNGEFHRVPLIIGGVNLLPNSNDRNFIPINNSTVVNRGKVSVPEWNTDDANRVTAYGGSNFGQALCHLPIAAAVNIGDTFTYSIHVKNNASTRLRIYDHLGTSYEWIPPNVYKRVVFTRTIANALPPLRLIAGNERLEDEVDFTWWRMQVEEGNIPTAWSPSFLDFQPRIIGAASTITDDNLDPFRAVFVNAQGKIAASRVTSTELLQLEGVSGNIQEQLNGRVVDLETEWIAATIPPHSVISVEQGTPSLRFRRNSIGNMEIAGNIVIRPNGEDTLTSAIVHHSARPSWLPRLSGAVRFVVPGVPTGSGGVRNAFTLEVIGDSNFDVLQMSIIAFNAPVEIGTSTAISIYAQFPIIPM